jgi:hypothetical protein
MEWCIKHGFPITIAETKRVEWPKAYKEATEKYASQVKLSPDGLRVQNYVAGLPFPNIDPMDPLVAMKIMWNWDYKWHSTDDVDLRNFDADTGAIADNGPMTVERHFLLDHFRRLFWNGRLYVEPKPEKPNPNGLRGQQGLYPILEPFDLKGVGALGNRYLDPGKQDDAWLYLPSLRRVRRLSTAQRSDALFGQDTDVDSYYGYSGHIAWMDFKFLGERDMIQALHAEHYPGPLGLEGRLGVDDRLGEAARVRHRGHLEALAVRVREARHLRRQGGVAHPMVGHLRPLRRAVEDMDQQREHAEEGLRRRQRHLLRRRDGLRAVHRDGRHAARARDEGLAPEPSLPRRAGLVFQPGREVGHHR